MDMMFDINPADNDRLLMDEETRRQELLDQAVRSFAPHLAGKTDVKVVHLHSTNDSLRKELRESFAGSKTILVEHCLNRRGDRKGIHQVKHDGMIIPIPKTADMVVTKSSLNSRIELFAAQLDALAVVLPEGLPYIHRRLAKSSVLVMVGAEQRKPL